MPDESRRTKSEQFDNVKGCVLVFVRVISKDDLPDRTQNRVAERPITRPLSKTGDGAGTGGTGDSRKYFVRNGRDGGQ